MAAAREVLQSGRRVAQRAAAGAKLDPAQQVRALNPKPYTQSDGEVGCQKTMCLEAYLIVVLLALEVLYGVPERNLLFSY